MRTDKALREALRPFPSITVRKTDANEYRVTLTLDALRTIMPEATRPKMIEKQEAIAAYCGDQEEAFANAMATLSWLKGEFAKRQAKNGKLVARVTVDQVFKGRFL